MKYCSFDEKRKHIRDLFGRELEAELFENFLVEYRLKVNIDEIPPFTTIQSLIFQQEYLDRAYQLTCQDAKEMEINIKKEIQNDMVKFFILLRSEQLLIVWKKRKKD